MDVIIPRNTCIPVTKKKKYTTDSDFVTEVTIKIFEGERTMTKDNFYVGQFDLCGLEKMPRGYAEMEITFSVDVNGIVNVTAKDLKNKLNENSIIISSNKGRLKPEQIIKLVKEARDLEIQDKLNREKKQLFYELDDLTSNIKINIECTDLKLTDDTKKDIKIDMDTIDIWVKEKKFNERDKDEYSEMIERIKKKYGTLILPMGKIDDSVKAAMSSNVSAVSIFEDKDYDDIKKIYDDNVTLTDSICTEDTKELEESKNTLIDLCHCILEVISNDPFGIEINDKKELKDFVNDALLWVYATDKPKKIDCQTKTNDVNVLCDKIFEQTTHTEKTNVKYDLEQLCFQLRSILISNSYSTNEDEIKIIKTKIDDNLTWLLDNDVMQKIVDDSMYQIRIDELNLLCNKLHDDMIIKK